MSPLAERAREYLALRRSLGHKLDDVERLLPRLVVYLEQTGGTTVTIDAALAWAMLTDTAPGSSVGPRRMSIARGFARFMSGIDPATEVPPIGLLPSHRSRRIPYLYSPADIQALMSAAGAIATPLRAATYQTLIGLLAATGMRVGEAIRLGRTDIDWSDGVLVIRESKFGKTRELPLHPSTINALAAYARFRDQQQPRPQAASFFLSTVGTPLFYSSVWVTFSGLLRAAEVGEHSPITPRIHDVRHSYAVRTVIGWYRAGEDVAARLPHLATYLGHRDPRHTYTYLSASPELLVLAAARLENNEEEPS
jgi:integrase/recombinase XerD